jgi:hypothetical protein
MIKRLLLALFSALVVWSFAALLGLLPDIWGFVLPGIPILLGTGYLAWKDQQELRSFEAKFNRMVRLESLITPQSGQSRISRSGDGELILVSPDGTQSSL